MSERRIDDKDLENISGAGGDTTPKQDEASRIPVKEESTGGDSGGSGSTGLGDLTNPGSGGDIGVGQG